jgi:hypothetical protein
MRGDSYFTVRAEGQFSGGDDRAAVLGEALAVSAAFFALMDLGCAHYPPIAS